MDKVNNAIEQTIYYMLSELAIPSIDKIKLVKLVFMADKYHLLNYGRTITNDEYYAMPRGPVGYKTLETLNKAASCNSKFFILANKKVIKKDCKCRFEFLSDTDRKAVKTVVDKFGKYETGDLIELTHKYPEWKQYEQLLKSKKNKKVLLKTCELLTCIDDDGFNVSDEQIKDLSEMLNG